MPQPISRRDAIRSLTLAAAATSLGRAQSNGLRAISVNHFEYASDDYRKTADWYADLLGLTLALDDGRQTYLWLGDTIMITRKPNAGEKPPYIGHLGYTVETYDDAAMHAELKRRGMEEVSGNGGPMRPPDPSRPPNPIAKMNVHVKDAEGYLVQICSKDVIGQMVKKPSDPNRRITTFKATGVNHAAYTAGDYRKLRDWYVDMLGMKITGDTGHNSFLHFGDSVLLLEQAKSGERTPYINRMAYTIAGYNRAAVQAELKRRGIAEIGPAPGQPASPLDELFVRFKDPEGYVIELCSDRLIAAAERTPRE